MLDDKGKFKNHITIKEVKTNKTKAFPMNDTAKKALVFYIDKIGETNLNGFIFVSHKGENKPITQQRAWQVINDVARSVLH